MSAALVMCFVLATGGIGAARVPSTVPTSQPEGLCIPLLMTCPTPTPTPSPTTGTGGGTSNPLGGLTGGLSGLLGGDSAAGGIPVLPLIASPDPDAPTMTLPAAQLGGSSISFTGLQKISLVTVGLANGTRTTVIRLAADSITINDFSLDVRPNGNVPGLVSDATQMRLTGHVVVYVNSVTASLLGGAGLTLGANTPIPSNETVPSQLLGVHLGLVGVTANSIFFKASHQHFE